MQSFFWFTKLHVHRKLSPSELFILKKRWNEDFYINQPYKLHVMWISVTTVQKGNIDSFTKFWGQNSQSCDFHPLTQFYTHSNTLYQTQWVNKEIRTILTKYLIRHMMEMIMIWMMGIIPMMPVANRSLFEWKSKLVHKELFMHDLQFEFITKTK